MKKTIISILLITILVSLPTITFADTTTEVTPEFYLLKQGSINHIVEAIQGTQPVDVFYDYRAASGNTPFMEAFVSKIYLYKYTPPEETTESQLSLVIHHNMEGVEIPEIQWMRVDFDFEFSEGLREVLTAFSDDPNHDWADRVEFDLNEEELEGQWAYNDNSDGGYLTDLPETPWSITIDPTFNINYENSIEEWNYQNSPNPAETDLIELNLAQPITITNDLDQNLSPVDGVGLDFDIITGPGSIGVTKLSCASTGLPTSLFDIQVTRDLFSGIVEISMQYDGSQLSKGQEKKLRLWTTDYIIPGDVNFDGIVDHKDIQSIKQAIKLWNQDPIDPNINNNGHGNGWNPCCNVDGLNGVTEDDLTMALEHLGEESPWFDITTFLDIDNDILYGETDHFSIFRGR